MNVFSGDTDVDTVLSHLCAMPSLANVSPHSLQRLVEHASMRSFAPGEVIIREGDQDNLIYFLVSGAVIDLHEGA